MPIDWVRRERRPGSLAQRRLPPLSATHARSAAPPARGNRRRCGVRAHASATCSSGTIMGSPDASAISNIEVQTA